MLDEAQSLISWDDVLGYLSVRGDPKPREILDESHEFAVELVSVKEPRRNVKESFMQTDAVLEPLPEQKPPTSTTRTSRQQKKP